MNIQNLLGQMANSSNPMSMLMGMLNPSQKAIANNFQNQTSEKQAEAIAKMCNEKRNNKRTISKHNKFFKKIASTRLEIVPAK